MPESIDDSAAAATTLAALPATRHPDLIWSPPESRGQAASRGRLMGRRILVVGAGAQACEDPGDGLEAPIGNGRAMALLCAREGAQVACLDKDGAAAQATLDMLRAEGGQGMAITADVADEQACMAAVLEAAQAMSGMDGMVFNVATAKGIGLGGTRADDWDQTLAINLRAPFLITRACLRRMRPGSSIVFIGSVAGSRPGTGVPAYDASKAGLEALCRHVAYEGAARGVRANVVAPGMIDTPLARNAAQVRSLHPGTRVPLGRQGSGWEVGYAALFLLSDEASYVTGQVLAVDGGLTTLR